MTTPHKLDAVRGSETTLDTFPIDVEKQNDIPGTHSSLERNQNDGIVSNGDTEKRIAKHSAEAGPLATAPPNLMDPSSYPDGGLQAWLCVLGAFCALFVSFGVLLRPRWSLTSVLTERRLDQLHRCLPELLPNSPIIKLLTKHCCMDPIVRSLPNVSRWELGRQALRQLRASIHHTSMILS
jgi:hypothetical protein